ncbi:MAG: threonine synthase [Myxococcota bacterium]
MISYHSTRDPKRQGTSLSAAISVGIAPDGGLYVPERLPELSRADFMDRRSLERIGERLLAPFFDGDALAPALPAIVSEAFSFPAPVVDVLPMRRSGWLGVLELFHGPTAAFKDFGARFLAAALSASPPREKKRTILVATSGDTGSAVAAAFHRRPGFEVVIFYPAGMVSERQEKQLTCWDGNVRTFSVRGDFDACQRLVKEAFLDRGLSSALQLSSANSINIGRLFPQVVYYAKASLECFERTGKKPSFIVPTGNLGNGLACIWAKAMGLPIEEIVLAQNRNRPVVDLFERGSFQPRPTLQTLASAMDVGNPSNLERLQHMFPKLDELATSVSAVSVDDATIERTIAEEHARSGQVLCPHTATAAEAYKQLPLERRGRPWIWVATAHPAKFPTVVEPLIGRPVPVPSSLAKLLALPSRAELLDPKLDALKRALLPSA